MVLSGSVRTIPRSHTRQENPQLYVCHDDGTLVNWQSSMLRNLLRVADFLPFAYALGLLPMFINREVAEDVLRHQRRRSLIVFITNTHDDDYDNLVAAIRLLSVRYLVIIADLREESLNEFQKTNCHGP